MNAKSFCLLFASASNLSILTLTLPVDQLKPDESHNHHDALRQGHTETVKDGSKEGKSSTKTSKPVKSPNVNDTVTQKKKDLSITSPKEGKSVTSSKDNHPVTSSKDGQPVMSSERDKLMTSPHENHPMTSLKEDHAKRLFTNRLLQPSQDGSHVTSSNESTPNKASSKEDSLLMPQPHVVKPVQKVVGVSHSNPAPIETVEDGHLDETDHLVEANESRNSGTCTIKLFCVNDYK